MQRLRCLCNVRPTIPFLATLLVPQITYVAISCWLVWDRAWYFFFFPRILVPNLFNSPMQLLQLLRNPRPTAPFRAPRMVPQLSALSSLSYGMLPTISHLKGCKDSTPAKATSLHNGTLTKFVKPKTDYPNTNNSSGPSYDICNHIMWSGASKIEWDSYFVVWTRKNVRQHWLDKLLTFTKSVKLKINYIIHYTWNGPSYHLCHRIMRSGPCHTITQRKNQLTTLSKSPQTRGVTQTRHVQIRRLVLLLIALLSHFCLHSNLCRRLVKVVPRLIINKKLIIDNQPSSRVTARQAYCRSSLLPTTTTGTLQLGSDYGRIAGLQ